MRKKLIDRGVYIIEYTEAWTSVSGEHKATRQRVVAEYNHDDNLEYASWMPLGQEWHSIYHVRDEVIVLVFIDVDKCTCVKLEEPK